MKIIGLTGGIGSGKSTLLNAFKDLGVSVYESDVEAKKLMLSPEIKLKIEDLFGEKAYDKGKLNRKFIASIVFKDKEKLQALNAIVHPAVRRHFTYFQSKASGPYIVYENAILFESKSNEMCDYIITVTAPLPLRLERVMKRDKVSKAAVLDRIKNQLDDTLKIQRSDTFIENIDLDTSIKKIKELHTFFLKNLN